jgi:hypothetical protein
MAYSSGNPARKIGRYRSNSTAACRRAACTLSASDFGRIWNTEDRLSSAASRSAIMRRNRSPLRRPVMATKHCIDVRHSTSSGLGAGNSVSGSFASSGTDQPHPERPRPDMGRTVKVWSQWALATLGCGKPKQIITVITELRRSAADAGTCHNPTVALHQRAASVAA